MESNNFLNFGFEYGAGGNTIRMLSMIIQWRILTNIVGGVKKIHLKFIHLII